MLQEIYLPGEVDIKEDTPNTATFTIKPYHPGYGPAVGNALRRVLLSSLPGAAITQMKIEKIDHEFSALPGIQEDIVSIMLNIKGIRVSSTSDDPIEIKLEKKGVGAVTAGDFSVPPEVKIINPDHVVAHITEKDATLEMTCTIERGRGYVPSEAQDAKLRAIGTIALDATFTPVERVSFSVENVRVGQATDYHSLIMQIATNGSITPKDALQQASSILRDHFTQLAGDFADLLTANRPVAVIEEEVTDEQISDIPGLGAKAVQDVAAARDEFAKKSKEEQDTPHA